MVTQRTLAKLNVSQRKTGSNEYEKWTGREKPGFIKIGGGVFIKVGEEYKKLSNN